MNDFAKHIELFEATTVSSARQAIADKERATFFIGRASCSFCRRFAGTLAGVVEETGAHIYFINSEEVSELANLQAFRQEYGIPTVPGFVHTDNGQVSVRCDSSMSATAIKDFAGLA